MTDAAETAQDRFSGTKEVGERHRFDEKKLEAYLSDHLPGFRGPLSVFQFKGGQSNPTYQLVTPSKKYVMRRKPPGKLLPSAHAVDREFRVLSALHPTGFPVAKPWLLCEDESITGTMFYVMDFIEGRVMWDATMPDIAPRQRSAMFDSANETLAKLHSFDYVKLGLSDYGKPGDYFARQISRWSKQYVASETEKNPEMDRLMEWLPKNIPPDNSVSLVHGDYHFSNIMFHPSEPRVVAVLDWEISTIGNPLGDLTYHIMPWRMTGDSISGAQASFATIDFKASGIPTLDEYLAAYCRRTGRKEIANLDFYTSYNLFRTGCILQGIVGRVRDGTAASPHAAEMAARVKPLGQAAWRYAQKAGAV
jgi:aminoglycoside phosphotransferase (APT) family kinase protein